VAGLLFILGCLVVGLAAGRFLLLPLPLIAVGIWDAASGPHNPDDDLRPIGNLILIVVGTVVLLIGVVVHKLARSPTDDAKQPPSN